LAPRQAHLRRPAGEIDPPNLALANQGSQLDSRPVYKEKGEDPCLDRGKLSPWETLCPVLTQTAKLSARSPIFQQMLVQTEYEHNQPVDASLEGDQPDQGPLIEAAEEWQCVRQQHSLPDQQSAQHHHQVIRYTYHITNTTAITDR
jgi:hypothetical protein